MVAETPAKRYAPAVRVAVLKIGGGGGGGGRYSGKVTIGAEPFGRGGGGVWGCVDVPVDTVDET